MTKRLSLPSKLGKPLWSTKYYVFVQTYFLSQLRKMLIFLISSYCKMYTSPTLQSHVFVCYQQYKHARLYCWQWTHFTMGSNEKNQHFAELRQKICLYMYTRSSAPNMYAKFGWKTRTFQMSQKSGKSDCQTRVRQTIVTLNDH